MSYFRLRDIKTPPFAYVLNRESAVQLCSQCQLPLREMTERLQIEIAGNHLDLDSLQGRPFMADHWLVGDATFGKRLQATMPDAFVQAPVGATQWCQGRQTLRGPALFLYRPRTGVALDQRLRDQFPAMDCFGCRRQIPDLPFNCQPLPAGGPDEPAAAYLIDLYLEGYDYLFHTRLANVLATHFPEMMLEKIVADPVLP